MSLCFFMAYSTEDDKKMLDIIAILLILFAIILLFYAITERSPAFCLLDAILWLILAVILLQGIETPYQMYNASSGNIETGVHTIKDNLIPITYLFEGVAIIMFILFITFAVETLSDHKRNKL